MAVFFGVLVITALTLAASAGALYYLDKDAGGLDR
jgi:hypothetical protein